MNRIHYGMDIGGTKIEIVVFDDEWKPLDSWRLPTPVDDYDVFLNTIKQMVETADKRFQQKGSLGIGVPGIMDEEGRLYAANLPGLSGRMLAADLSSMLERSVIVEKDSLCFTQSEVASGGAAEGYATVFGAILGTGAGAGIIANGQEITGKQGAAGEWGHLPVSAELKERYSLPLEACGCGLTGCVEHYIAGPGLAKLYELHGAPTGATTQQWVEALRQKDPVAVKTYHAHQDILGYALANVVKILAPEIIVMGGGLSNIDEIVEGLPNAIGKHYFRSGSVCAVVKARFGDSSGVRGAALLGAGAAS